MPCFRKCCFLLTYLWTPTSFVQAFQAMKPLTQKTRLDHSSIDYVESIDDFVSEFSSKKHNLQEKVFQHFESGIHMDSVRMIALSQTLLLLSASMVTAIVWASSGLTIDINTICWGELDHIRPNLDIQRVIEGALAAIPVILTGTFLAKSDNRDFAAVNFSTMDMVINLFGRRINSLRNDKEEVTDNHTLQPATPTSLALMYSVMIATMGGVCEEIVFRGLVPSTILHHSHSLELTLFSQAALFGMMHISPKVSPVENKVVSISQTVSGFWYGVVYLLTGGDILPCIIAHALHDSHVFMKTWMEINRQMDYTESAVLNQLTTADQRELRTIKEEAGPNLSFETLAFVRRFFYAFDYDRIGSLSKSDVQRALSYAFLNDNEKPNEERVKKLFAKLISLRVETTQNTSSSQRLELPEFTRLILHLRANPKSA